MSKLSELNEKRAEGFREEEAKRLRLLEAEMAKFEHMIVTRFSEMGKRFDEQSKTFTDSVKAELTTTVNATAAVVSEKVGSLEGTLSKYVFKSSRASAFATAVTLASLSLLAFSWWTYGQAKKSANEAKKEGEQFRDKMVTEAEEISRQAAKLTTESTEKLAENENRIKALQRLEADLRTSIRKLSMNGVYRRRRDGLWIVIDYSKCTVTEENESICKIENQE
jgi:hypothetical protein